MKKTITFEAELVRRVRAMRNPPKMLGPVGEPPSGVAPFKSEIDDYVACSSCGYLNCIGRRCETMREVLKPAVVGMSKRQNTWCALDAAREMPELTQCIKHFADDNRVRFFFPGIFVKVEVCGGAEEWHWVRHEVAGPAADCAALIDVIDWMLLVCRVRARYTGVVGVNGTSARVDRALGVEVRINNELVATLWTTNDEEFLQSKFDIIDAALAKQR